MLYYVLLSGGSGKRLWPLSNEARPKQYIKLVNRETNSMERCSMLQRVWDQLLEAGMAQNTIITAGRVQYCFLVLTFIVVWGQRERIMQQLCR